MIIQTLTSSQAFLFKRYIFTVFKRIFSRKWTSLRSFTSFHLSERLCVIQGMKHRFDLIFPFRLTPIFIGMRLMVCVLCVLVLPGFVHWVFYILILNKLIQWFSIICLIWMDILIYCLLSSMNFLITIDFLLPWWNYFTLP